MRNKSKNMYGKITAILLTAVLLTAGLSCTALAEEVNLIKSFGKFDPAFEDGQEIPENSAWVQKSATAAIVEGGHGIEKADDPSGHSIKLANAGDFITVTAPVEPGKNYTFAFWMKNALADVLQLQGGENATAFYAPEGTYNQSIDDEEPNTGSFYSNYYLLANVENYKSEDGTFKALDWKPNATLNPYMYFGYGTGVSTYYDAAEYTFGSVQETTQEWRKVSINFTTPPELVSYVKLMLACIKADDKLAIDDLTLFENGFAPNRVFNGNFEATEDNGDSLSLTGITLEGTSNFAIETDSITGNHYLKIYPAGEHSSSSRVPINIVSKTAPYMVGKDMGSRYKISYKAKAVNHAGVTGGIKLTAIQFRNSNAGNYPELSWNSIGTYTDEWQTFTLYLDGTNNAKKGAIISNYLAQFVKYADTEYTLYVDDLYSWYDKSNIGFYKDLKISAKAEETFKDNSKNDAKLSYVNEMSTEAPSISELSLNGDGTRTVKVRAHYLPEVKEWGDSSTPVVFSTTDVTLLSAVYEYETDEENNIIAGTKKLVSVDIDSATSTVNGETIDVVGEVSVPAEKDGVTYQVEAMAWDMDSMKPVMEKAVLK